jgi:hypothetical protein
MARNPNKRRARSAIAVTRSRFSGWLIPPAAIPTLLILLAVAYGLYRMWA